MMPCVDLYHCNINIKIHGSIPISPIYLSLHDMDMEAYVRVEVLM
jgi:hypothetical protein